MRPREFTPEEANATLPALRDLLPRLRDAAHERDFLEEQLDDLRRMYGERLADPRCEAHADHARLLAEAAESEARLRAASLEVQALGVEVKDAVTGLVDFYARRGDELVYLCWKEDEDEVAHWHPLVGGFAARRPL